MADIRIAATSDTHSKHRELNVPDADVFVHAGDFTRAGSLEDVLDFARWVEDLPHEHKLVVAGNHEMCLRHGDPEREAALQILRDHGIRYLEDESVTVLGFRFHGTPWVPPCGSWAFTAEASYRERRFRGISNTTDVLISHGPSHGVLDWGRVGSVGCTELLAVVNRVRPLVHICGHIHEGAGVAVYGPTKKHSFDHKSGVIECFNVAACDRRYQIANEVQTIIMDRPKTSAPMGAKERSEIYQRLNQRIAGLQKKDVE